MTLVHENTEDSLRVRGGVELHAARHVGRGFETHFHEEYQIIVVADGGLTLTVDGVEHDGVRGDVLAIAPGQVHAGRPHDWGWACRIFYPSPALMDEVAESLGIIGPCVTRPIISDAAVARSLVLAHQGGDPEIEDLRQAFGLLLAKHGRRRPRNVALATAAAEACIRAHFAEKITLERLAALCDLSRYHFLRVFAREWGMTPMAYQTQVRVAQALRLLRGGVSSAMAAQEAGFFDQSHLIHTLRKTHALTPSLFRRRR